jgi:hypothetical protein
LREAPITVPANDVNEYEPLANVNKRQLEFGAEPFATLVLAAMEREPVSDAEKSSGWGLDLIDTS